MSELQRRVDTIPPSRAEELRTRTAPRYFGVSARRVHVILGVSSATVSGLEEALVERKRVQYYRSLPKTHQHKRPAYVSLAVALTALMTIQWYHNNK